MEEAGELIGEVGPLLREEGELIKELADRAVRFVDRVGRATVCEDLSTSLHTYSRDSKSDASLATNYLLAPGGGGGYGRVNALEAVRRAANTSAAHPVS
ncbi:MAG: hypothetical protein ACRDHK_10865 [Actinomycetota bacterium]